MPCNPDKHRIEVCLTCEEYERLCEAAQFVGCGTDLERYIKSLIAEHC